MVSKTAPKKRILQVRMNGLEVGKLTKSADGAMVFEYAECWSNRPISLSLPLQPKLHSGDVVFNFFDNLLPDNPAIRQHIQQRFDVNSNHPFDLLEAIGKDCIGAIQLYPEGKGMTVRTIIGKPLSDEALQERILLGRSSPLGMDQAHEEFRISLAGVQDKTALLWHDNAWQSPEGTTPTTHIIKLPLCQMGYDNITFANSIDNEWLCLKLLALYGLDVAHTERLVIGDSPVLSVERFDRKLSGDGSWIMRLPQEDMCQAQGYSSGKKYQADGGTGIVEIMALLEQSSDAERDRLNFFKANFLFWLMAAPDGHAKNFSIFIESGGTYRLTPMYDVLSFYPLLATKQLQKQKVKMAMAWEATKRNYHWHKFQLRHVFATGEQCGLSAEQVRDMVSDVLAQTDDVLMQMAHDLPDDFPREAVSDPIFDGIRACVARLQRELEQMDESD